MTRLTDDALAAIRARAEAATPGPWGVLIHDDCTEIYALGRDRVAVFPYRHKADAAFACDARADVPALLAHIAALREESKAWHDECREAEQQRDTLAAKLAEVEPPAVDVCQHCGGTGQVATMEAGCGALLDCICAPGPGYESLASAIRALPDEEPPSGYVERAEVRRCEVAVVEAAEAYRDDEDDGSYRMEAVLFHAVDALRAAREKAGGK